MKKKILISLVACFIAAGSFIGYNLTENTSKLDVSLADISVMAQADGESGGGMANVCCPIWDVTITYKWSGPEISCSTGGNYKCEDCVCPS